MNAVYYELEYGSEESQRKKKSLKAKKAVSMGNYPYTSGVVLYGLDTINSSWPAYCDHFHLYSFYYTNVNPASSVDSDLDLSVNGWSMTGFPGMCSYVDWMAISYPLIVDVVYATTGDQFAMTCGYWTEYEWNGDDDVYFEIASMNAIVKTASAFALAAVGALFF